MKIIKNRFVLIKKYIKNKEVLDFGSSTKLPNKNYILKNRPNLFYQMKSVAKEIVGVDIYGDNKEIIKGDATKINLKRKFDVVVMAGLINHIEDHNSLINNANEHLKENGYLIITTLNIRNWRVLLKEEEPEKGIGEAHVSVQTLQTLKNLLKRHNFEVVDGAYYYGNKAFYPFPMWIFGKYQYTMVVVAKRKKEIK